MSTVYNDAIISLCYKNILLTDGNLCVTLLPVIIIKEYIDSNDRSPYAKWFNRLNAPAAARVVTALVRMEQGNLSLIFEHSA